jgi:HupE / UreJ protein
VQAVHVSKGWLRAWSLRVASLLVCALAWAHPAQAHEPSKSYLSLLVTNGEIAGQWDIPLSDLQKVVPLGQQTNGFVTWEALHDRYQNILTYAQAHLKISADGRSGTLRFTDIEPTLKDFADGEYVGLPLVVDGLAWPQTLELDYRLFFETNSLHRGLLRLQTAGKTQSAVFSPEAPTQRIQVGEPSAGKQFLVFLKEGINHIWTGYDHILFLLALLLPAVLRREPDGWYGVTQFRPAFVNVFKIVTAFTVAHSITLSLATLHLVRLPSRLTESSIAASVVLAATNNLWPMVRERGWMVAFAFGLIHGFGFANALSELGLTQGTLLLTLVGFNLGVEIGQLCLVAVFFPMAYAARGSWWYQKRVLGLGSATIIMVAGTWLVERVCNLKVLPF